jgi:uncharacterized protein YkwD
MISAQGAVHQVPTKACFHFRMLAQFVLAAFLLSGCNAPMDLLLQNAGHSGSDPAPVDSVLRVEAPNPETDDAGTPTPFLPLPITPAVDGSGSDLAPPGMTSPTPAVSASLTASITIDPSDTPVSTPMAGPSLTPILTPTWTPTPTHTSTRSTPPPPSPTHTAPPPAATRTATFTEVPAQTPTASPTATHTQLPPSPTSTLVLVCSPSGNNALENAVIARINQERSAVGLSALSPQSQLSSAARVHSADMACNNFVSHTGSDGSLPWDRVAAQGYSYSAVGENIYAGGGNADAIVSAWMNSPGHRDNILNANYTEIGLGYRFWTDSTYGAYVTAVFARPR